MNLRAGGLGKHVSEDTKKRISISNKGKVRPQHVLDALSKLHKGKTISEEQRLAHKKFMTGRRPSEETLAKMRIAQQKPRKPLSDETRKKMSDAAKKRIEGTTRIADMIKARGGVSPNRKKVINTVTGEVYSSATEAYKFSQFNYDYFKSQLNGCKPNKTTFKYYDE